MSALRDAVAMGSTQALAAQRVLNRRFAESLDGLPPETLVAPRNARALVRYALTGGTPDVVRRTMDRAPFEGPHEHLLSGALAFLEGRQADAQRHFDIVDLRTVDDTIRGPVELALAALAVGEDPAAALAHLDEARLAAPGTLIEEAALRRAVLIAAELNDATRMEAAASRYMRKFRNSVYAGNHRRRLGAALTRMRFLDDPGGFERLDAMLEPMSGEGRAEILLDLARSAVEAGRHTVASKAAERATALAEPQTLGAARAALYGAAAGIVDADRHEDARTALNGIDPQTLPPADRALHTAALELGDAIATLETPQPPGPDRMPAEASILGITSAPLTGPEGALPADSGELDLPPIEIAAKVDAALADIDTLLRNEP